MKRQKRRRSFLAAVATVGVAGCLSDGASQTPDGDTTAATETESADADAYGLEDHAQKFEMQRPSGEDFHLEYVTQDGQYRFRVGRTEIGPYTYFDPGTETVKEIRSERGRYVSLIVGVENLSGSPFELTAAPYPVYADGEWYWPSEKLRSGVELDQLRDLAVTPNPPEYSAEPITVPADAYRAVEMYLYNVPDAAWPDGTAVDITPDVPDSRSPALLSV
ncbi:hypothetical protein [Natronomonas sp. LN261]|jgi:hypothetical protein|uniref:hypothetical protein n=1 Tax=Natronomonas sp. LN261 TaxID=2750669 RepID=UPI0015EE668E|nr:hypothetical protein [Natronomonas sp. LN261]